MQGRRLSRSWFDFLFWRFVNYVSIGFLFLKTRLSILLSLAPIIRKDISHRSEITEFHFIAVQLIFFCNNFRSCAKGIIFKLFNRFQWLFQLSLKFSVFFLSSHVLNVNFLKFLTFDIFLQCLILFFNFEIFSFDLLDVLIHSLEFTFKIFDIFTQRITLNLQVF